MNLQSVKDEWFRDDPEKRRYAAGNGSWLAITDEEFELARRLAVSKWAVALSGVEYPWLCWSVADDWCLVQQRMVRSVGWTPVVGYDPRAPIPTLIEGSILIDFNDGLGYPALSPHFPMELVFMFAPRLAFWHSDLLIRKPLLKKVSDIFKNLKDGEMAAVDDRTRWYKRLLGSYGRYWELLGCTTNRASASQFEHGCGWWRRTIFHPNCKSDDEREARKPYTWDQGGGILIWQERFSGRVIPLPQKQFIEGHCTRIGNPNFKPQSPNDTRRDPTKDLVYNYDLEKVCYQLGLLEYLRD